LVGFYVYNDTKKQHNCDDVLYIGESQCKSTNHINFKKVGKHIALDHNNI